MTTDACRLMRPGAVASMEHSVARLPVGTTKLPGLDAECRTSGTANIMAVLMRT